VGFAYKPPQEGNHRRRHFGHPFGGDANFEQQQQPRDNKQ